MAPWRVSTCTLQNGHDGNSEELSEIAHTDDGLRIVNHRACGTISLSSCMYSRLPLGRLQLRIKGVQVGHCTYIPFSYSWGMVSLQVAGKRKSLCPSRVAYSENVSEGPMACKVQCGEPMLQTFMHRQTQTPAHFMSIQPSSLSLMTGTARLSDAKAMMVSRLHASPRVLSVPPPSTYCLTMLCPFLQRDPMQIWLSCNLRTHNNTVCAVMSYAVASGVH